MRGTLLVTITSEAEMLTAVVSGSKDLGDGKISVFVGAHFSRVQILSSLASASRNKLVNNNNSHFRSNTH